MKTNDTLNVFYDNRHVGTLAMTNSHKVAFQYSEEWLRNGFSISPFSLPPEKKVFVPSESCFDGLFGVFADSLPDNWGRLLLSRLLKERNISMDLITVLDRLAIVGSSGMGALEYRPEMSIAPKTDEDNLDELAEQCRSILNTEYSDKLDELFYLGGSSGGARPKILTEIDGTDWIIKFPAHVDSKDAGKMEYDYSVCAKACGILMPETKLFLSKNCKGYFGVTRFDRSDEDDKKKKRHMLTAAALLELDYTQPSLDYNSLMKLTKILTGNNMSDMEGMFRIMCFNVFAHNRDDHSKNFSFLYDEEENQWHLSPAYDLTYSSTYYGEHTTTVDGNGKNPGEKELLSVGRKAGMKEADCMKIIHLIRGCVNEMLEEYIAK